MPASYSSKPIRVLHALGGLNHGGIETWLMQLMPRIDANRIQMDFLVHSRNGAHEADLKRYGCRIFTCRPTGLRRPWSYLQYPRDLQSLFRRQPPYDVVHSHMQEFGAYFLRAAARAGVPTRLAHSHNGAPRQEDGPVSAIRRAHQARLRGWVDQFATAGLACSQVAAQTLFGDRWEDDSRWRVLHYGIDLSPFDEPRDRQNVRESLGLPADCRVVGHVGRFVPQKNHAFLLKIAAECIRRAPDLIFLLVGDGPLRNELEQQVRQLGLSHQIRFVGARWDVPRLMLSAMDLMILPSLWEGFGIVVLEAQAAGLGTVLSDRVSAESSVLPDQVERLSLDAGPSVWANCVLERLNQESASPSQSIASLEQNGMSIDASADAMEQCYLSAAMEVASS